MNLVYNILFIITALIVIIYDYKYQKIPLWVIILNFSLYSLIVNPILLLGNLVILLYKKLKKPIDFIYIIFLGYLIIIVNTPYSIICAIPLIIQIISSKKDKMSFMISIEIAYILEILVKEMIEYGKYIT